MNVESAILASIQDDPADDTPWLVLADWLEEAGQEGRGELVRLQRSLRRRMSEPEREEREGRVRQLLAAGVAPCVPVVVNSVGMELALIPAGTFWMGSLGREANRSADEGPRHRVEITRSFYLGVCPVTQEEYEALMGSNPSYFSEAGGWAQASLLDTSHFPVENISWHDACDFCRRLSGLPAEQQAGRVYRLPTEAEWEYACRAGTTSKAAFSVGESLSGGEANFDGNYPCDGFKGEYVQHPTPVGSYRPNAWGVFDMHGNVWEWCQDWFEAHYYASSPTRDPTGPPQGETRVQRGGSWYSYGWACRCAQRCRAAPEERNYRSGFRVAMDVCPGRC